MNRSVFVEAHTGGFLLRWDDPASKTKIVTSDVEMLEEVWKIVTGRYGERPPVKGDGKHATVIVNGREHKVPLTITRKQICELAGVDGDYRSATITYKNRDEGGMVGDSLLVADGVVINCSHNLRA